MRSFHDKLVSRDALSGLASGFSKAQKTLVSTNGCFDLLHLGHIEYLQSAKRFGDVLLVGVNSDASVRKLKGRGRPVQDETTRALQIAALESVDYVFLFSDLTPVEWLEALRPQVHVKGADYLNKEMPEREVIAAWGGRIELIPFLEGYSTTGLIERLKTLPDKDGSGR